MPKLYRLYRYALFLADRFKALVLLAIVVFLISTTVLYNWHPEQLDPQTRRELGEVAFGVFELMFASEPALPYPKSNLGVQIIFFALPVLNVLGLAAAVAQFSQILFDRGLYNRAQADNADAHVILCGIGRLGREVLKQLDRRHHMKERRDIVLVESGTGVDAIDEALIKQEPIIPVINGDMTHSQTLREAGIHRAAAALFLSGDDTANLEAALLAREMNPDVRIILRMDNKYIHARLNGLLNQGVIRNFRLVDSVAGAAPRCAELCRLPASMLIGSTEQKTRTTEPNRQRDHVVVCGLGRLGFGVVRQLKNCVPLIVIDAADHLHYADDPMMRADPVVPVLRGDITVKWVLQEASVERAAAVLLLTSDDTVNLEAALLVHELNPSAHIVLRINNSRIASRLDGVLRDTLGDCLRVIDPSEHAAPQFIDAIGSAYDTKTWSTSRAVSPDAN